MRSSLSPPLLFPTLLYHPSSLSPYFRLRVLKACSISSLLYIHRYSSSSSLLFVNMAKSLQPCYVRLTALILFVCLPFWCDAAPYSTFNSSLDGGALYLPRQVAKQATGRIMFPDQMSEAAIEPFHIFPRGISQDPSCPAGFLCDLEACPASVECQPGDSCFNFEGTIVCGSPALQWCAFNPSTFEAVGCTSGQCW